MLALLCRWFGWFCPRPPKNATPAAKGIHARFWTATTTALNALPDLKPAYVRTPLPYDIFAGIEAMVGPFVAQVRAAGARPLFVTSLATKQGALNSEVVFDTPALATFYARLAAKYPGCAWELGNEPEIASPSNAPLTSGTYAIYARTLAAAIRKADSTATIVSGGTSGIATDWLRQVNAQGGFSGCDAIGAHPYGVAPTAYATRVAELAFLGKPIWFTEYGKLNPQPQDVSDYFSWAAGVVPVAVWFELDDNSDGAYGLMTVAGARKAAFASFVGAR